ASVTIEGGNITVACPGTITVHASKKSFAVAFIGKATIEAFCCKRSSGSLQVIPRGQSSSRND
ncbi:hypothetical protein XpopCFBP1817_19825, partial [Xanthomonas populi]